MRERPFLTGREVDRVCDQLRRKRDDVLCLFAPGFRVLAADVAVAPQPLLLVKPLIAEVLNRTYFMARVS